MTALVLSIFLCTLPLRPSDEMCIHLVVSWLHPGGNPGNRTLSTDHNSAEFGFKVKLSWEGLRSP